MIRVKFLLASEQDVSKATFLSNTFENVIDFAVFCFDNKFTLSEDKTFWLDVANNKYFIEEVVEKKETKEVISRVSYSENRQAFLEYLSSFCNGVFLKCQQHLEDMKFTHFTYEGVVWEEGSRYFKILVQEKNFNHPISNRIHCFVDKHNGGILKAATWKAPAKIYRGNIFNPDNGLNCVNHYGAKYLR